MDKLLIGCQPERIKCFLQEILYRLYVVVGYFFDGFDARGIFRGKLIGDPQQVIQFIRREGFQLWKRVVDQSYKVLNFYQHPVLDQGVFGEKTGKISRLSGVAPVDRGNSGEHSAFVFWAAKLRTNCEFFDNF